MSHFIYGTKAIVLGEMPQGEDSRLYFLLTENLGLILAQATGVRLLKSKLRFHLSLFDLINAELVRGKNIWRLVSASSIGAEKFHRSPNAAVFGRLSELVRRMVHGEEENEKLFAVAENARELFLKNDLSLEEKNGAEALIAAKILSSLGYFDGGGKYETILSGDVTKESLRRMAPVRNDLVRSVNAAIKESHL